MKEINITLPDNTTKSFSSGVTPQDVANSIGSGLARAVVVAKVNGLLRDLNYNIHEDSTLELFTGDTPEGMIHYYIPQHISWLRQLKNYFQM